MHLGRWSYLSFVSLCPFGYFRKPPSPEMSVAWQLIFLVHCCYFTTLFGLTIRSHTSSLDDLVVCSSLLVSSCVLFKPVGQMWSFLLFSRSLGWTTISSLPYVRADDGLEDHGFSRADPALAEVGYTPWEFRSASLFPITRRSTPVNQFS